MHFYVNFSILKFEDGQFLSVPPRALDVKSGRNTKGYPFLKTQFHFSVETGSTGDILFRAETYNYRSHRLPL